MQQPAQGVMENTAKRRLNPMHLLAGWVAAGIPITLTSSTQRAVGRFFAVRRGPVAALLPLSLTLLFASPALLAGDITPAMQTKIDQYKKQAVSWAADPLILQAVKDANTQGPITGLGNAKWRELKDTDPMVHGFVTNATGKLLTKWLDADAKGINKIVLSGAKSQRVGFTSMPAIYLGKGKPNFDEAMDGKVWQQGETKPDASTNIDTVQVAAPVNDGDEVIGVLLVSLTADNLKK
jgi:hypothetical protein